MYKLWICVRNGKVITVCCRKGKYYKWEAKRRRGTLTFFKNVNKCWSNVRKDMKTYQISNIWKRTHYKKKSFKKCENTSSVEMLDVLIFGNLGAILFLLLYNCLLLYLIKKNYNKENITYKNYIESRKVLLINFFTSTSDVIGIAENNTSHAEKARDWGHYYRQV